MLTPRTALFVPGDRPDRIPKALAAGTDATIIDLEDAVAASSKAVARKGAVAGILAAPRGPCKLGVRVNALATGLLQADVHALSPVWPLLDFLMLPMVPDGRTVRQVVTILEQADMASTAGYPQIVPLIETAGGVLAAADIAMSHPRVCLLAFGPADLCRELCVMPTATGSELLHARSALVLASAAGHLQPPLDGPWLDLHDTDGLRASAAAAMALGFGGKQVIHPSQVETVMSAFTVSAEQVAWAEKVVEAFSDAESQGVSSIKLADGTFVDYPVAQRARILLDRVDRRGN